MKRFWRLITVRFGILSSCYGVLGLLPNTAQAEEKAPQFCAAIQGNGDAIFSHFHSLARVISHYGMVDAAAGSSSATITMFLLESMLQNPAIKDCNCSKDEKAQRVSLMLKSLVGFFEQSPAKKEATALYDFTVLLKALSLMRPLPPA